MNTMNTKNTKELEQAKAERASLDSKIKELEATILEATIQEPQPDEVWSCEAGTEILFTENSFVHLHDGTTATYPHYKEDAIKRGYNRVGTFDEVFVLRDEHNKEAFTREGLKEKFSKMPDSCGGLPNEELSYGIASDKVIDFIDNLPDGKDCEGELIK